MISEDQTSTDDNEAPRDDSATGQQSETVDDGPHAQLEKLEAELADAREQILRAAAEAQNVRRRAEKDVENARKFGLERLATELLPVMDNLERALAASDAAQHDELAKPVIEGVELTLKSFADVLARFNIEPVDPAGEPFNPELHEAMSMIDSPDAAPNSVINVVQKGYTLNGRLLRPAMVMVARS